MKKLIPIIFMTFYLSAAQAAQPGEVVEWVGLNGGINWTKGIASAEGIGGVKPSEAVQNKIANAMSCRAALVDARRNILEIINGVRIESETFVEHIIHKANTVKESVDGIVRGSVIKQRDIYEDGTCKVVIEVPISGPLATAVYEQIKPVRQSWLGLKPYSHYVRYIIEPQGIAYAAEKKVSPSMTNILEDLIKRVDRLEQMMIHKTQPLNIKQENATNEPTGLVIDARGLNFVPSLHPRIRETKGNEIYPIEKQKKSKQAGNLVALFMNDLILAQNHPRVGEHPVVIKGLQTYGKYRTEIVLAKETSEQIKRLIENDFLINGEVIIVLD